MSQFFGSEANSVKTTLNGNNEDDHQSRLEECKQFFQQFPSSKLSDEEEESIFLTQIRCFLFDRWSVIRFQCYKSFVKIIHVLPVSTLHRLITMLQDDFKERQRPWQELHGCLLAYDAMIAFLQTQEVSLIPSLVQDCLEVIGHIRNPIRDAAKDCMVKILSYGKFRKLFLPQILALIQDNIVASLLNQPPTPNRSNPNINTNTSSINMENETNTLKTDGLLNVIVDLVNDIHSNEDCPSSLSRSVQQCFTHPASTVRQKAGNIITSILKSLFVSELQASSSSSHLDSGSANICDNEASTFAEVLDEVLLQSLLSHSKSSVGTGSSSSKGLSSSGGNRDHWQEQEVSLMICEEIMRDVTNQYFSLLHGSPAASFPEKNLRIIHSLMVHLQQLVPYYLTHPRFEVRRVVLQLLPTLARAKIILPSPSFIDQSTTSHEALAPLELMSHMIWLSTLIKENRHLFEVLHSSSSNGGIAGENWSNEVHGRLLEVQLRQDFHKQLDTLVSSSDTNGIDMLTEAWQRSNQSILQQLHAFFTSPSRPAIHTYSSRYMSTDFIEFFALTECFLFSLSSRAAFTPIGSTSSSSSGSNSSIEELCKEVHRNYYVMSWLKILSFLQLNSSLLSLAPSSTNSTSTNSSTAAVTGSVFNFLPSALNSSIGKTSASEFIIMYLYSAHSEELGKDGYVELKYEDGELELEGIRLLPTLTDPATNPLIYTEEYAFTQTVANVPSEQPASTTSSTSSTPQRQSSLRISTSSGVRDPAFLLSSTTPTPSTSNSAGLGLLSPGISAKSPSITSPNRVGPGCNVPVHSSSSTYQSMNRWNCEALSPLLLLLCHHFTSSTDNTSTCDSVSIEQALILACILGDWIVHVLVDPMWLDNRKFARKVLVESLPTLLEMVVAGASQLQSIEDKTMSFYQVMCFYLLRTITEMLTIAEYKQTIDIRTIVPIVKSAALALKLASKLNPQQLQNLHRQVYVEHSLASSKNYSIEEECSFMVQSIESLIYSVEPFLEKYRVVLNSANVNSGTSTGTNTSGGVGTPVKTSLLQQFDAADDENEVKEVEEEEDEFSDWDDESEDDESSPLDGTSSGADSCGNGPNSNMQTTLSLVKDMEDIIQECMRWKDSVAVTTSI